MEAKRDTLPQALALLREILREPAFPAEEFETSKRRMVANLEGGRTEPVVVAANKLGRSLSPYPPDDVRYAPTIDESLARVKSLTLEQVKNLYATQLGATRAELAVVGDFDPQTTLTLVKQMLAGWRSSIPVERIDRRVADERKGSTEDILTPDKSNAEYLAGLSFRMSDSDPDYPALLIGNFIFGGSTLASRLGDRIRQKDGLSYGASSLFAASSHDPVASLTVSVSTNPVNIDKVAADVRDELARFLKDGPTETELADAKEAFVESRKVSRTSDAAIGAQIVSNLDLGRTFAHAAKQEQVILALSPAKVTQAFRKHVDPKKLVILRAGDFKK